MKTIKSMPNAPCLIESMRSLGYSFESAIADLVDNCISAKSKNIYIIQKPANEPELIIIDDGYGMDSDELIEALRFGSKSPKDKRNEDDLGRYGLGMKSASLSQCRQLIVASKKEDTISCFSWDIDKVNETNDWSVLQYDEKSIDALPEINTLKAFSHGTYVLLRNFDRIAEASDDVEEAMQDCISRTKDHLSLVFHRIMSEDGVKIFLNNSELIPKDPFLEHHKGTQPLDEQKIWIDDKAIIAKPFILPHMNALTSEDLEMVGGKDDLRANQGFYIYRCRRLIIWGTWFRMENKREINKLARVRVDIPNSLDSIWDIDVKKSTATIPYKIRKQLSATITASILKSGTVIGYRGSLKRDEGYTYIWERETDRDNNAKYSVNRKHESIQLLYESLNSDQQKLFELILSTIENGLLVGNLYADAASDRLQKAQYDTEELIDGFNNCLAIAERNGVPREEAVELFLKQEPFINYNNFKEEWRRKSYER